MFSHAREATGPRYGFPARSVYLGDVTELEFGLSVAAAAEGAWS